MRATILWPFDNSPLGRSSFVFADRHAPHSWGHRRALHVRCVARIVSALLRNDRRDSPFLLTGYVRPQHALLALGLKNGGTKAEIGPRLWKHLVSHGAGVLTNSGRLALCRAVTHRTEEVECGSNLIQNGGNQGATASPCRSAGAFGNVAWRARSDRRVMRTRHNEGRRSPPIRAECRPHGAHANTARHPAGGALQFTRIVT